MVIQKKKKKMWVTDAHKTRYFSPVGRSTAAPEWKHTKRISILIDTHTHTYTLIHIQSNNIEKFNSLRLFFFFVFTFKLIRNHFY